MLYYIERTTTIQLRQTIQTYSRDARSVGVTWRCLFILDEACLDPEAPLSLPWSEGSADRDTAQVPPGLHLNMLWRRLWGVHLPAIAGRSHVMGIDRTVNPLQLNLSCARMPGQAGELSAAAGDMPEQAGDPPPRAGDLPGGVQNARVAVRS